jgi:hypothetical protein
MLSLSRRLPDRREEGILGRWSVERRAPTQQVVAQHRAEVDLAHAGLGLGVRDVDRAVREIDVADFDPTELRVTQPGTGETGDDRPPCADPAARVLLGVVDRGGLGHAQAPTDLLPRHALVAERACRGASLEDLRRDRLVDLGGAGEQVLELVDLQRVPAGALLLQT